MPLLAVAALATVLCGCSKQETNEAANTASRKVSEAASEVANKSREVAQNVNRSAGPALDDAAVTARIKAKLLADGITGTDVDTAGGAVTLTGTVASDEQKARAEKHAQETEGVKSVKNGLLVKGG
jgi:hyperosmotically inducible protein